MATYYVGPGGNNANAGTSWALRKLTLNGAEDIPVAAGDTVYVGPGTYRETLTADVSGTNGNPITYIGDYTGANTSGVKGVVRITGSDNDNTATRTAGITSTSKNYRTFQGFLVDGVTQFPIYTDSGTNVTIDKCYVTQGNKDYPCIGIYGTSSAVTVSNSFLMSPNAQSGIYLNHSATVDNTANVIKSCIILGNISVGAGILNNRIGGVTVSNCSIFSCGIGIRIGTALTAGQTMTVNNCNLFNNGTHLSAVANDGSFVEDYNNLSPITNAARTNVTAGANSVARLSFLDTRWFFESVNGGRLVTPFDLASYSTLVEYNSGTDAPSTDMRGASVVGTYREWGALEYSDNYRAQGPVSIAPIGGIG